MSPAYYADHLRCTVQFEAGVRTIAIDPAALCLEVGPGTALTSLTRLTLGKDAAKYVVPSLSQPQESRAECETIFEAAGKLWLAGVHLDWRGFHTGATPRRIPLPTYPFERQPYRVEASHSIAPGRVRRPTSKR